MKGSKGSESTNTGLTPTYIKGITWFFGIGINLYDEKEFNILSNTVKDIEDFLKVIKERYERDDAIKYVILRDDKATLRNIIDELNNLRNRIKWNDSLIVYYSGHGHFDSESKRGFWVPQDAKKSSPGTYIHNSTILDYLEDINAYHTLLISDTCYSMSIFMARKSSDSNIGLVEGQKSRWAMCSGRIEKVSDGLPGKNSPFCQSLLAFLRGNKDFKVSINKIGIYVKENTPKKDSDQIPYTAELNIKGHDNGDFVFTLLANEEVEWGNCKRMRDKNMIRDYLQKFPEGKHIQEAESILKEIKQEEDNSFDILANGRKGLKDLFEFKLNDSKNENLPIVQRWINQKFNGEIQIRQIEISNSISIELEMITVESGRLDEKTISSFNISKYPITLENYKIYCNEIKKEIPINENDDDRVPIINVTCIDAVDFCNWLSQVTGNTYRLPTEAEWEFAARGGNKSKGFKFSGSEDVESVAFYRGNSGLSPQPVGQLDANELGLYDMCGNVWEWCRYSNNSNRQGEFNEDESIILRGGSWQRKAEDCTLSSRSEQPITDYTDDIGFRIVESINQVQ